MLVTRNPLLKRQGDLNRSKSLSGVFNNLASDRYNYNCCAIINLRRSFHHDLQKLSLIQMQGLLEIEAELPPTLQGPANLNIGIQEEYWPVKQTP